MVTGLRGCLAASILAAAIGLVPAIVRADGEAGLVVQHGDGTIDAYCIRFPGDGISGEELLRQAGVPYEQLGGLVCAIGANPSEGCRGATNLQGCTCRCPAGGSDCVYWSYFTRSHGQGWVYSAIGFTGRVAGDGDLQAWRWGKGGPASAPAPVDITFEQVCGHAPGLLRATATPTATPTRIPPGATPGSPTVAVSPPGPTAAGATSPIITLTRPPAATPTLPGSPGSPESQVSPTATPSVRVAGPAAVPGDAGGGGSGSLVAFAAVAAALVVLSAAGVLWRRRRER